VPPAEESAAYQPQEGYQQPEAFVEQPVFWAICYISSLAIQIASVRD
jgi:hypothetical protein